MKPVASSVLPENGTIFSSYALALTGRLVVGYDFSLRPWMSSAFYLYIQKNPANDSAHMSTEKVEYDRAPLPETVDHEKEAKKLWEKDAHFRDNQGSKEAPKATTGSKEAPGDESVDYESMTVPELKDLAQKRGVHVTSDMRKDEIIDALED
jgi:hypothetical protein